MHAGGRPSVSEVCASGARPQEVPTDPSKFPQFVHPRPHREVNGQPSR